MTIENLLHPSLGFGLGLRSEHYFDLLDKHPAVDWLEILSENYMIAGGKPLYYLDKICEQYPVVMHGVSLSIGSTDPLDLNYLTDLKALATRVKPKWISDHLCWTGVNGINLHDLMPLPYTEEALQFNRAYQRSSRIPGTTHFIRKCFKLSYIPTFHYFRMGIFKCRRKAS